ncbi:MAG: presqualene diphosphate synthase HpnD [Rhodospirillales bacterium]|nr:presqualene diphosphate synthase HpnD [Alphaproteobacteria bacterium]MBL6948489.1 presqualene diphosphate synthase HpnD [Rhodospirillales bacterium]
MNRNETLSDADAAAYVEEVVRRAGSSFYWGMRRLPGNKRRAMYAVYAFCREVDDLADGDATVEEKIAGLGLWRGDIERLYGGHPRNPVTQALSGPVEEFGLGKEDFRAVIDGMEMDASDSLRIADMDELTLYCDRVACAVGRLSVRVFGLDEDTGRALAFAQGQALQLTNILRDIEEDARRDRLYIPRDLLASYGITEDGLPAILSHPAFPKVCEILAGVAANHFARADELASGCDAEQIRPAVMMMEIYRAIFLRLKRRGWQDLSTPVGLGKLHKLWLAFRYGVL